MADTTASAETPGATGSAQEASAGLLVPSLYSRSAGTAYSPSVLTGKTVVARSADAVARAQAYDVNTSRETSVRGDTAAAKTAAYGAAVPEPQTEIRKRISGMEPVSSWSGREPSSRAEGSEEGS